MKQIDLDELDLDLDIGSSEGLSVDQMTRSRLQFLLGQSTYIIRQIQFADAKAATLLAIVGVLAIIVADREAEIHIAFFAAYLLLTISVVAICLVALLPRVPSNAQAKEMRNTEFFSWPALSSDGFEPEQYAKLMRTSDASQLVISIARSNIAIARVLRLKYKLLRGALVLALIDLVALGLALLPSMIEG